MYFLVILLYINIYICYFRYHCSYGPEDHRNKKELRQNHKRGCLARYSIKILAKPADTVEIAYFHEEHTRIDGTPAHGVYDPDSSARPSALATRWSDSLKTYIDNRLKSGLNARQIYDEHHQVFADRSRMGFSMRKDDTLLLKNIRNIERTFLRGKWKRHINEAKSVDSWITENKDDVFILQESNCIDGKNTAFVLGLQSPEQFNAMIEYGDKSAISMDATFGTSACNYFLYTLMVFDACRNGFLGEWIIINKQDSESLIVFLKPLVDKLRAAHLE